MSLAFEPSGLFGLPPGADFPRALVDGLVARLDGQPADALARVTVLVNTRRMARRIEALFDTGPAQLLPRIRLVTDLGFDPAGALPPPVPPLRRQLELTQLVAALIEAEPDLAPRSAAFDLATSLSALLDEMQGEGVGLDALEALDVGELSGHWARSLRFLRLVGGFLSANGDTPLDPEARRRRVVEATLAKWETAPPRDPVIVAGSTGSRGTTAMLMAAVARLPNGAVVLPGLDPHMPPDVWRHLTQSATAEDHPQYRFAALAETLGCVPWEIPSWHPAPAPAPARNALLSLALRPAPVTDGWRRDGPALGDLRAAVQGLTLIEAPDPRHEALAIALRLRQAVEDGQTVALVTPDRMLTRRVAAALERWGLIPDDSAGEPLRQAPVGRLFRHAAALFGRPLTAEALVALLKHPLVHSAGGRNRHLILTRDLERALRRDGSVFPDAAWLARWAGRAARDVPEAPIWAGWVAGCCLGHDRPRREPLTDLCARLTGIAERLALGPDGDHSALRLWSEADGKAARKAFADLAAEAGHGGSLDPPGFAALIEQLLSEQVRDPRIPDERVMIWGTLEARVQGADLLILGGLNDGTWPESPAPDPWLNRPMRAAAGLLLPDRRIGLSAHDFQQAVGAPEAVLTRALRDAEAETVPSRWLNRLTNLLGGLPDQGGPEALKEMRRRGGDWLVRAAALDRPAAPVPRAPRPAPQPPVADRPRALSVTQIERLLRDPYDIYADKILRLRALPPLHQPPDARDRGTVLHAVMEKVVPALQSVPRDAWPAALLSEAEERLARDVASPAARRLWLAGLAALADGFLAGEAARQARATPLPGERRGALDLGHLGFRLTAKADRIDRAPDGRLWLYDYKTGSPPTAARQLHFDKQLLLTALIATQAGFEGIPRSEVAGAEYLALNRQLATVAAPLDRAPPDTLRTELEALIAAFQRAETGYAAHHAPESDRYEGDYSHLARAGEWDPSDPSVRFRVGD